MLGAVRDGDYIGHDNDFDAIYISAHQSPQAVKDEFIEICRYLLDRGYSVEAREYESGPAGDRFLCSLLQFGLR